MFKVMDKRSDFSKNLAYQVIFTLPYTRKKTVSAKNLAKVEF